MADGEQKQIATFGIKLSEIRSCDACGGPIAPVFSYVQIRMGVFNSKNSNQVLGMMQMWGKQSMQALKVAEALAPGADEAVEVVDEADATTTLFICSKCILEPIDLTVLMAKVSDKKGELYR